MTFSVLLLTLKRVLDVGEIKTQFLTRVYGEKPHRQRNETAQISENNCYMKKKVLYGMGKMKNEKKI